MAILLYKWLWAASCFFLAPSGDMAAAPSAVHPLYISVTEINHNNTDKTLEISCKIFTDDFEKGIAEVLRKKVDLSKPANQDEANKLVSEYVTSHLHLRADNRDLKLDFVGFEKDRDVVWSYFQVSGVANPPKSIAVKNNILYETYESQINMMHVTVSGKRKSSKVSNPKADVSFDF